MEEFTKYYNTIRRLIYYLNGRSDDNSNCYKFKTSEIGKHNISQVLLRYQDIGCRVETEYGAVSISINTTTGDYFYPENKVSAEQVFGEGIAPKIVVFYILDALGEAIEGFSDEMTEYINTL